MANYLKKGVIRTDLARRVEKVPALVEIYTELIRVEGFAHVMPGSRLLDFLNTPAEFVAITDATIFNLQDGRQIKKVDFLALRKSSVIILMEKEEEI